MTQIYKIKFKLNGEVEISAQTKKIALEKVYKIPTDRLIRMSKHLYKEPISHWNANKID